MRENFCLKVFLACLGSIVLFASVYSQSNKDERDISCKEEQHCKAFVDHAMTTYPNYEDLKSADLIDLFGYPVEEHKIHTADGYILTVQRIPYSDRSPRSNTKIPVFIQHGLFSSSATWFWQPTNRALVFMLADAGYDVWIGNVRGTSYSSEHEFLTTDDLEYWDFSSHEVGKFDVPATIDYITVTTGQNSIYYICHSLGCHQFFVGVILNPELNEKIRTFFGMAPAIFKGNTTAPIFTAAKYVFSHYEIFKLVNKINKGRNSPKIFGDFIAPLIHYCKYGVVNCGLCASINLVMNHFDTCQTNFTTLPGFLAHHPDPTSAKLFSHAMQDTRYGYFREYDYGRKLNKQKYGSPTPPDYDWSKVNLSAVLYRGLEDDGVTEKDVAKLEVALGSNVKESATVEYKKWTHLDFVIGKDADVYVYQPIINIMNNRTYG